jgi:hypothetical protein
MKTPTTLARLSVIMIIAAATISGISAITLYEDQPTNLSIHDAEAQLQQSTNDPTQIDGMLPINDGNVPIPEPLTNDEESRVLGIVQNDPMVSSILARSNWKVAFVSPVYDNGVKIGGATHIILEKPIWFEGTYHNPPTKQEHTAKLWLSALDVFVDLNKNSVTGIDPGVGNPAGSPPASVEHAQAKNAAQAKAVSELKRSDLTTNLLAIYQTPEHPDGIAFYMIDSTDGSELSVGVDLNNNQVVDKYTAKVIRERN